MGVGGGLLLPLFISCIVRNEKYALGDELSHADGGEKLHPMNLENQPQEIVRITPF